MKKIFAIFSALAVFASCSKEAPVENGKNNPAAPAPAELEMVSVEGSVAMDSKVTIGTMKWESGDKIKVWVKSAIGKDGYDGHELDINPSDGKFSGQIAKPANTDVLYVAYNASGCDKDNGPIFAIPAVQSKAANGATEAMLKQVVEYNGEDLKNLSFTLTAATAKLQISVAASVTGVEFSGMNNEIIADGSSKTITYTGTSTTDVELIVPAMTFDKGYKVIYTKNTDKMYQSYGGGNAVTFEAGKSRSINCSFAPFSISCEVDAANAPKTSYDYYLAGNITKANSADFETVGRLSGGTTEKPWQYDEDAQGIFTGKIERGKAKVVISGMSSSLIPSNLKIKEYGCYVKRVGGQEGKDVYATGLSIALSKNFSWDVLYKSGEADTHMIEVDAGDIEIKPYLVVNNGTKDTEYVAPTAYTLHVTGLPHRSDHKDLWYVCSTGSGANQVSGKVERHNDEANYPVDMFRQNDRNGWEDYCVRTRYFNIPAETKAQIIMHGTLWAPHSINAYFWFDATKDSFVFHKNVDRTGASGEKLKNLSDCDAYDEESEARQHTSYFDLGTTHGHVNDNTITLSPAAPAASVYLWIHRGTTVATDYVGYWCRYIKVQYAPSSVQ